MKPFSVIEEQITLLNKKLESAKEDHSKLTHLETWCSVGVAKREEIFIIRGQISALYWVINNQIDGDL